MICKDCSFFAYCKAKYNVTEDTKVCKEYSTADYQHLKSKSCKNCIYKVHKDCRNRRSTKACRYWWSDVCICGKPIEQYCLWKGHILKFCSRECSELYTGKLRYFDPKQRVRQAKLVTKAMWRPDVRKRYLQGRVIKHTDEARLKMSIAVTAAMRRPEVWAKILASRDKIQKSPWFRKRQSKIMLKAMNKPEVKRHLRTGMDRYYQNLVNTSEQHKTLPGCPGRGPNKAEQFILEDTQNLLQFTGDFSFWRNLPGWGRKNPDFIVVPYEQTKKVVEYFGDYWHNTREANNLVKAYARAGIDCLLIWQSELYGNYQDTIERIISFCKSENKLLCFEKKVA